MIKKEHKINPIPNYIDITKADITKWEDGLYTLGLDKDKGLVTLEKPIHSSNGDGIDISIPIDNILKDYSKTGHKHNPADINLNSSNRFVTDTEKGKWNTAFTNATNTKKIVENIKMSGSTTSLLNNGEIIIPTIAGPKGEKGEVGPQGLKGEKGDTGAKGDKGNDGKDGTGVNILGALSSDSQLPTSGTKGDAYLIDGVLYVYVGSGGDTAGGKWQNAGDIKGLKGDKGDTGPQGLKGDTGAKGDTGPQGLKGDTGAKGATGPAGKDGFNPYWKTTGSTILVANNGERDLKGADGAKGDKGAKGDTGLKGDTGPQGVKGDTGAKGAKGDKGDTGAKGDTGLKGDTGPQGPKGDKGDTGAKGDTGEQGEKGDKGDAGSDANVTKDNVEIALGYTPLPQSGGLLNDYVEKLVIIGENNSINLDEGNTFLKTISADTTFSIDNTKAGAHSFTLIIEMDTLSALTFPTEVKWQDGEAPDMSEANKTYILTFLTIDNGLTWFGMKGGAF